MDRVKEFLFFVVDQQCFAIPLECVKKVLQVVEIRPLPQMPPYLHGAINYFGQVLPIINLHYLFACGQKSIELSDQLIILKTAHVKLGLLVDQVQDVRDVEDCVVGDKESMMYGSRHIQGVIKHTDGMVIINDVDAFLDENQLAEMMDILRTVSVD